MSPLLAHRQYLLWLAAFATGLLLLFPRPAHGVTLSWNAFRGAPGSAGALDLACTTGDYHPLVADFEVPETLEDFIVLEAVVDLGGFRGRLDPPLPPLSPFWHFETGGCNPHGALVSLAMPSDAAGRENPWGDYGANGQAYLFYQPDVEPGHGRFLVQVVRAYPSTLSAGQRYFAFRLILNTCAADVCEGCDLYGQILVSSFHLGTAGQQVIALDPFAGDENRVCMNTGGWCGIIDATDPGGTREVRDTPAIEAGFQPVSQIETLCGPTAARNATWGAIKVLYR